MVQNSIIVASPYHLHHNYTGSFLSQITYSWTSATASVYPPDRPTTLPPTYPSFNLSLLPGSDTKEVTSTPQIIPPPPYLRYVFHTFTLRLKTGLVLSSVTLFHPNNLPTPYKTLDPPSLHCFQYPPPPPPLHDLNPTKKTIADLDFTTTHIQLNINYKWGTCKVPHFDPPTNLRPHPRISILSALERTKSTSYNLSRLHYFKLHFHEYLRTPACHHFYYLKTSTPIIPYIYIK